MIRKKTMLAEVTIIATGGTIASHPDSDTGALTTSLTVENLLSTVPELNKIAKIKALQFANISSWSINVHDMFQLWKVVKEEFSSGTKSLVITHGTDTLEETAYFLDLCHKGPQTLVITGAMRVASEIGADGPRNIFQSVKVSIDPQSINKGVLVVINDEIFSGSDVFKKHSWQTSAFSASNGAIGEIVFGNLRYHEDTDVKLKNNMNGRILESIDFAVPIFKAWSGDESKNFLEAWESLKIDGLVVEGTGVGNIHPSILGPMQQLLTKKIPVIISTRVQQGGVIPIYGGKGGGKVLKESGYILADTLSAAKARLKLIFLLGSGIKKDDVRFYF